MRFLLLLLSIQLQVTFQFLYGQGIRDLKYEAGFTSFELRDSTRTYKPETTIDDSLHLRPLDIDVWYPSQEKKQNPLRFRDLFSLLEQRASKYGDENFSGFTNELALYYMAELGLEPDPKKLLDIRTQSYSDIKPVNEQLPIIIYMAGLNGMGFENYKLLERLAQAGFLVVSIWSVGRYPGNMSNQMDDMMEQVYDAEAALKYLERTGRFSLDLNQIGVLGTSWGGMSAAVLVARNPGIRSFVSLDGSETHYFGNADDVDQAGESNDRYIRDIHAANILKPEDQTVSYLYLESGDKLNDFNPVSEYSYYKMLPSEKKYLRFLEGKHADFLCIPSILNASASSTRTYQEITDITLAFFRDEFSGEKSFSEYWKRASSSSHLSTELYNVVASRKIDSGKRALRGKVLDAKTKRPLEYASVGVLNGQTGTIANEEGAFELDLRNENPNDTLSVSSIGYQREDQTIGDMLKRRSELIILLEEKTETLNEVLVYGKNYKKKVLGNKSESRFISAGFRYDQLGAEIGVKIDIRKKPTLADAFNFSIAHNRLSAKSVFRLNFYDVLNGRPGVNILKTNIFVAIAPQQTGIISIDLKPYEIVLNNDIFATLEWVENIGDAKRGEAIYFSLGMVNNGTIHKPASHAKFRKYNSLGVGFNIDVRH